MSDTSSLQARWRRIRALTIKETLQVSRDPSSFVVAFVLPALLLFLFGFGISFDATRLKVGLTLEEPTPAAREFLISLSNTRYFEVRQSADRRAFLDDLSAGKLNAVIVLAGDFAQRLGRGDTAAIQVVTDGSDPNTAALVNGYVQGAWRTWEAQRGLGAAGPPGQIDVQTRVWFNPELESRRFLVPGSISLIQMMIGSLLTALVVSREWERGTMEALLATPVGVLEFILGKLAPNFILGMCAMGVCVLASLFVFDIPLRGSLLALTAFTAIFLIVALSLGLLISTVARTQFLASQMAMMVAFLPGLYFSGFLFEVASMPAPLRAFARVVPAYYYVPGLQTIFLAGDIWAVILPASAILLGMSALLFTLTARKTRQTLD
ncbi:ABC-2 type transport system permease protein [Rhodoblastus acidophilus]|uniref:ABC-2 type transport system permease protein n=1 Tax=Rhodoblastus acidophilus TaxID=1074 RepID=A0A212RHT1_RHOAC|nr:ABC transporter permease [Rhodoblastus acidophilus]MCW2316970.1 ABC-2 type transport system permease protein [Rhodoblastus acidophilus]PPQ38020.1 ABC transporter permease [Rhodoblastus acidophilus]RAI24334.1 ABC transporter permease [Rhodoblastus acidophilus]SNB71782.1 ABC-2 type transport system permease protein [Rhodoblastus acidophilus]